MQRTRIFMINRSMQVLRIMKIRVQIAVLGDESNSKDLFSCCHSNDDPKISIGLNPVLFREVCSANKAIE